MGKENKGQTTQQTLAKHAWDTVEDTEADNPFGRHAKKLPARIRAAGLGQALAFVHAKARPGEAGKSKPGLVHLLKRMNGWVLPRLRAGADEQNPEALILAVMNGDSVLLRRATLETLAWLEWVNRFAEAKGLGKELDGKELDSNDDD